MLKARDEGRLFKKTVARWDNMFLYAVGRKTPGPTNLHFRLVLRQARPQARPQPFFVDHTHHRPSSLNHSTGVLDAPVPEKLAKEQAHRPPN
ncbi:hypothetical protein FKW77_010254 [Venturia effusa]|uniref:Uncharacterized protein n=1 Tax=Venturia effusa TaxID=50376 RepID=A0A517L2A8_9PEZI|nr:hypothetical protein FKW77_010254 [Venturia effusa]